MFVVLCVNVDVEGWSLMETRLLRVKCLGSASVSVAGGAAAIVTPLL